MQPEQSTHTTIHRVVDSFDLLLSMADSPSSSALPAEAPGDSDPPTHATTAEAATTVSGNDTARDYYAFKGETVKLLNHVGTVLDGIQKQQTTQAANLTEVSGRLAPETLGSVIAGHLQPAFNQFGHIVTKRIAAAINPVTINSMVETALAAQSIQTSAPTAPFYSFGPTFGAALAPATPITQLPRYDVTPDTLVPASTDDAEMLFPEDATENASLSNFWVGAAGLQACYDNWGYPWLFGCHKELQNDSTARHQEVQAFIKNLQAGLPNKQPATSALIMQPPSKSQSVVYHSAHPNAPFVPLVPTSPVIGSVVAAATSSVLLPTMASTANKSKIDQEIATFDKITQTSDVVSWLDDVSLACAITDTAHDKWVLVAGTHMTGAPLQYFKTAYSKARKQGQAALDAFCEWENFVVWCEKTLNRRDH